MIVKFQDLLSIGSSPQFGRRKGFFSFPSMRFSLCVFALFFLLSHLCERVKWQFWTNFNVISLIVTHWISKSILYATRSTIQSVQLICGYIFFFLFPHSILHSKLCLKVSLPLLLLVSGLKLTENGLTFVFLMNWLLWPYFFFLIFPNWTLNNQ